MPEIHNNAVPADIVDRVKHVLTEDRERPGRIKFSGYKVSREHRQRMSSLPQHLQIPRSQWATHPNYVGRFQMPNFHHEFRQELQRTIKSLWAAVQRPSEASQHLSDALAEWRDFETRMAKHIRIEEGAIFPSLARHYPALDFSFLYEDHEELGQYEKHIGELLQTASSSEDAAEALRATVKFDLEFMDHLGEEEEFVVPLCLSTKHCALHGR